MKNWKSTFVILVCFLCFLFVVINPIVRYTLKQLNQLKPLTSYTVYSYTQDDQVYKVTAYCACVKCCGLHADRVTASGYRIQPGDKFCATNAADFDFLTVLIIPKYGIAPVLDRGGAIKENCIDVYFDDHDEALKWGTKYLKVKVVK